MISCMVDIETLSLEPAAPVLSIGVALFNDSEVTDSIGWAVDLKQLTGVIDPKTVAWWSGEDAAAAREYSFTGKLTEAAMAFSFKAYLAQHNIDNNERAEVWANDPHFDYIILKEWWKRANVGGSVFPIHYRSPRSYKTIIAEAERLGYDVKPFRGTYVAHNPVEDAVSQARVVIAARQLIGRTMGPPT